MKAIQIHRFGGPEVMVLEDVDLAAPAPGEAQIRHTAIGVNFIDTYRRSGIYPLLKFPFRLGQEGAGVVVAVGDNVRTLKIGDRVAYGADVHGAYAEMVNAKAERLVKIPDGVSDETAAGAMLKGFTAWMLLRRVHPVQQGETVLIHAAAGGVGLIACQWAKHLGATVIGTVGSQAKAELARAHGCDHTILYGSENFPARVAEITNGKKVPVVFDAVGKDTFYGSLDCLAKRGLMVNYGNASGLAPDFSPNLLRDKGSLVFTRPSMRHFVETTEELNEAAGEIFSLLASGAVKIDIRQRFKLAEAKAAHEALHARNTTGATILLP